ncbi:hypothetical protein K502DRAFT_324334 [Neoconidiobolus thromboides FSU 785]|nr:hypothetical protein K502DRAFT_324334 [Neoconidiobolus thromboides FSU 785]
MSFIDQQLHHQIFPLYFSNDIDLTLFWDTKEGENDNNKRYGCHHIIGINFGIHQNPLLDFSTKAYQSIATNNNNNNLQENELKIVRNLFESTQIEKGQLINSIIRNNKFKNDLPIKVKIDMPEFIHHNFDEEKLLTIQIHFQIKNCSWNRNMNVELKLLDTTFISNNESILLNEKNKVRSYSSSHSRKSSLKMNQQELLHEDPIDILNNNSLITRDYYWTQDLSFKFHLKPNQVYTQQVNICFIKSGTFNLNLWCLNVDSIPLNVEQENFKAYLRFLNQSIKVQNKLEPIIKHVFNPTIPYIIHVLEKKE